MNNIANELLGKALDKQVPYTWHSLNRVQLDDVMKEFAELIVRECLNIVEPNEDSGDEWCVTLKGAAQEIKEHFGVEE